MHINCPHCQSPIEVVESAKVREVVCPSCGSSVSLSALPTKTAEAPAPPFPKAGRFVLTEKLGEGAFGSVWRARDPDLGRDVAVKLPRSGVIGGPENEERFLREARAAGNLKHDGIVTVHEVGRQDGTIYIVSDFVHGVNLAEWLLARKPNYREAAELVALIAEALGVAHRQGVVHRDIKPSNIMLRMDSEAIITSLKSLRPVIMDFGLAKREAAEIPLTREGRHLGTPAYMSPEQARGESHKADARSDVWSLGVVLYELLTGERPFRGEERMLLLQILQDEPKAPRRLNGQIPRDLETITLKCLQKEPQRRYATAADLAGDLRRWLRGEPIQARPVGNAEWLWRGSRRNPLVAALVLLVSLSLILGTAVSTFFAIEANRRADENLSLAGKEKVARKRADENATLALRRLYISDMKLAQAAWENNRVGRVLQLLEQHGPDSPSADLRGFEWFYWKGLCHRDLLTLKGNTGAGVLTVTFSPDGTRIASGSDDGTVKLWDLAMGQEIATLNGHAGTVDSVAFSPDGLRIASASRDQTVKLWDATTGQETATLKGHTGPVTGVAFSPDGGRIASVGRALLNLLEPGEVKLWNAATGQETAELQGHSGGGVASVAFSPDGARIASASYDRTVKLWDVATGLVLCHSLILG